MGDVAAGFSLRITHRQKRSNQRIKKSGKTQINFSLLLSCSQTTVYNNVYIIYKKYSITIAMQSILYLLVNEEKTSFKIGITDDIEARHARLSAVWGKFDLASSRSVTGTRQDISGLEKTLHYLLAKWQVQHTIKVEGHSEWFAMECFDKALDLISSAALIRGTYSENLITTGIVLPRLKKTPEKKIYDDSEYRMTVAELKQNLPCYEQATLDFRDGPDEPDQWLWTIDSRICKTSPFKLLSFQIKNQWVALATAESYFVDTPWISDIALSKFSLVHMGNYDGYREAYEFLSEMIRRLCQTFGGIRSNAIPPTD